MPAYIMYGERLPRGSFLAIDIAWRADQVLYGIVIDSDSVGSCIFTQDRALGSEVRAKEYGRPFGELAHY